MDCKPLKQTDLIYVVSVKDVNSDKTGSKGKESITNNKTITKTKIIPKKEELRSGFSLGPPEIEPGEIKYHEKIGGGCFGEVFRGVCRGIEVAVKRLTKQDLDPKTLKDFRKEVQIACQLHHPNVVLFMGACTKPGHMAIVTELMPKGTLEQVLHHPKVDLSLSKRVQMARDAALGLNWLHQSNPPIVHRDIKPSNFLVDKNLCVKVCDFGLSDLKPHGEVLRDKDSIPGTPLWMAPEVLKGGDVDEKSDVYSFGIVLWEILTKEEPFPLHDDYNKFKNAICIKGERPPIPENCLPSLRLLIESCWRHKKDERPSFEEIIEMLDRVIIDANINDEDGRTMWKKYFLGKTEVLWNVLVKVFTKTIGVTYTDPDDLGIKCLKALLIEGTSDPMQHQLTVTLEKFGKFCYSFGPIKSPPKSSTTILEKITVILQKDWFHGEISKEEAERRLTGADNGTFLIRLSSTEAGSFTISKKSRKGNINHQRIHYNPKSGFSLTIRTKKGSRVQRGTGSLDHFVDTIKGDLYLKRACGGSVFQQLFMKEPQLDGYLLCDD